MLRRSVISILALAALGACDRVDLPFEWPRERSQAGEATAATQAPESLRLTGEAIWDGRPSLGGVWVAHAGMVEPRQVTITHAATGASVRGALFRKAEDGPAEFQVSSDAAAALGIPPDEPVPLTVADPDAAAAGPADDAAEDTPQPTP